MAEHLQKAYQPKSSGQDDSVMGTNNSSIVSKRSVERLYYPDEPHFFRYFVKRPQRRAPLINRGYWLRMKAIEHVVRQFLEEPSGKQKIVINLGCGYDPNPWQCLSRYPDACKNVKFIDVDYMSLMEKKRDMVRNTAELSSMLAKLSIPEFGKILLQSDQYLQVGCDLRELSDLSSILASVVDMQKSLMLFTAEVSITYMDVEAADALIQWACDLPDARFCLLEQILPEGPDHPFAKTMLAHFDKLRTPLRAVKKYPTTADQEGRFKGAGWENVRAINLWELWSSTDFLKSAQRTALDDIEPFDEWEEFVLFACHYFLLSASNGIQCTTPIPECSPQNKIDNLRPKAITAWIDYVESPKPQGHRRYGCSLPIRGTNRKRDLVGNFGGIGSKSRLSSYDAYGVSGVPNQLFYTSSLSHGPSARMCHTITDTGEAGALLVGGRTSPDTVFVDCWLYHKWIGNWERVDDLPKPRYRHSAVVVGRESILIFGGKSSSRTILNDFSIWTRRRGWTECVVHCGSRNDERPTTFGGILAVVDTESPDSSNAVGILAGGICQDGTICQDLWLWTLNGSNGGEPSVVLEKLGTEPSLARFGASIIKWSGQNFVVGGVTPRLILTAEEEILMLDFVKTGARQRRTSIVNLQCRGQSPRPLLVGISSFCSSDNLVIMGGGAVCFSFGTYWNLGCFTLGLQMIPKNEESHTPVLNAWNFLQTVEMVASGSLKPREGRALTPHGEGKIGVVDVQRTRLSDTVTFSNIVSLAKPVIMEGLDLGSCTKTWTSTYLKDRIGREKEVVIHQAAAEHMDFVSKNFRYVTQRFGQFIEAVDAGEMLYLRSLSAEKPSELPADLGRDFPAIANDFKLPPELKMAADTTHSSALRISGPVNMWLHYDVMANVLCQIRGHKRLLLFPPSDVQHIHFSPGASSSSMDVFSMLNDVKLAQAHPHEAILGPGDVLFLPALWLHAASPTEGMSIAANVFFRSLESGYAPGRDIYGNRDLQAYEKGRQDIARIAKSISSLPEDPRNFYILRLAEELREIADSQ